MAAMAITVAVLSAIFGKVEGIVLIVVCGFLMIGANMALNFIFFQISFIAENYPTRMRNTSTGFIMLQDV